MAQDVRTGVVVVGVDGSADADAALRHGMAEAVRRGGRLRAVIACRPPEIALYAYDVSVAPTLGRTLAAARDAVAERVDAVRSGAGPELADVPVEPVAVLGSSVDVLVEAARHADLLVVGHRGRGSWRSAMFGSTGLGAVLNAPCPVTVVRVPRTPGRDHLAASGSAAAPLPIGPIA
ncbi:MAG TPA: universal stress protein [Actinomycetospora sp.]|jgi:nucleotide-binding universal stress UspA family protein|uniref:universal stress protein n=1 Tax=Actinomycetospora sp. TaxID=1872135 RepID=UPI002F4107CD